MALGIENATFGYDISGTQTFLQQLKSTYLDSAASDAKNITEIESAIDTSWAGQAADDFKTALHEDANALSATLEELYYQLENEINNIGASIADTDSGMMSNLRG